MQDGAESNQGSVAADQPLPPPFVMPPRRRSGKTILLTALLAFFVGAGLAGWLVWRGDLDAVLPDDEPARTTAQRVAGDVKPQPGSAMPSAAQLAPEDAQAGLGGVETRLALLEDRFSRINQQADAASANASRAEALLIALAARRMIDRGEPLGYLEYQLQLRFGSAQPKAVQTIIAAGRKPITLYLLSSQLEAAAPALSGERSNESTWAKISREVSSLFVVRRSSSPAAKPLDRAERAQVLLKAGRVEDAIAEVERLPGADDAQDWIASARRYDAAQRALEVIETTAMLEPRELRDGEGLAVSQPSPLTPPADKASADY
jgi:hypothetical protein